MKKLIIVHYHLRPGGVRRVIELATPYLVRQSGIQAQAVVLATGEKADPKWRDLFRRQLAGASLELFIEPSFRYCSEQSIDSGRMQMTLRAALDRLLAGADSANTLVWMHNPGLGRNLLLVRELTRG